MQPIRLVKKASPSPLSRIVQREIRVAQLIRLYPSSDVRRELRALLEELEVTDTGNGQLITNFSNFGVCTIDWQGPRDEFMLDKSSEG